jgi:hypothetical protein
MVTVPRRADTTGSALVRLLAGLTQVEVAESKNSFSDRLSQWLDWKSAMALSAALKSGAQPHSTDVRSISKVFADPDRQSCERLRNEFIKAFAEDTRWDVDGTTPEFSTFRQRYFARQQAMERGVAPFRQRLRARLSSASPSLAQLAVVDNVMEQSLGARERTLLSSIPALLHLHFERLRSERLSQLDEAQGDMSRHKWLENFCRDMRNVLAAELDVRLQPVEGLLDALHPR